jgi:hypothetical protein
MQYAIFCAISFLGGFVHRLYFNKITMFRKLDILPSSDKKNQIVILLKYRRWTKSKQAILLIFAHHRQNPSDSSICNIVGFEVFMAVSMKMAVFWVVAPCSLVEFYQRFRGPCCLHHQGGASP